MYIICVCMPYVYVCSSEQLLREKIEAVGELASMKSVVEEEKAKASFNIKELEVSLSTLELENQVCRAAVKNYYIRTICCSYFHF